MIKYKTLECIIYNWNVLFLISSCTNGNLIFSRYLLIINLQVLKYNKGYIRLLSLHTKRAEKRCQSILGLFISFAECNKNIYHGEYIYIKYL